MSRSSGVHVIETTGWRNCNRCEHSGIVDVWYDQEINARGWECPKCGKQREESL